MNIKMMLESGIEAMDILLSTKGLARVGVVIALLCPGPGLIYLADDVLFSSLPVMKLLILGVPLTAIPVGLVVLSFAQVKSKKGRDQDIQDGFHIGVILVSGAAITVAFWHPMLGLEMPIIKVYSGLVAVFVGVAEIAARQEIRAAKREAAVDER